MKEISYWEQFMNSGKIDDYLRFKEQTESRSDLKGEVQRAGFYDCNRDDHKGSAYR